MVWKLKKTKAMDDEAGVETEEVSAAASVELDDTLDFATGVGPSEAVFSGTDPAEGEPVDFYSERLAAVDDAIESLTTSKKQVASAASNGSPTPTAPAEPQLTAGDDDDWSLDAFAPYKPPQRSGGGVPTSPDKGTSIGNTGLEGMGQAQQAEEIDFTKSAATDLTAGGANGLTAAKSVILDDDDIELLTSGPAPGLDDAQWQLGEAAAERTVPDVPVAAAPDLEEPERTLVGADDLLEPIVLEADPTLKFNVPVEDTETTLVNLPPPAAVDDDRTVTHVNLTEAAEPPAAEPAAAPPAAAKPAPVSAPRLEVKLGQFTAKYDLTTEATVIGRPDPKTGESPEIAIEWDDAISRRHAHVIQRDGLFFLVDLDSKNGTFLNGEQLAPQSPIALKSGDEIVVGERTKITFLQ
jgi:pSer/pThr/pTyr-binding forkhead associated (FHA) protein